MKKSIIILVLLSVLICSLCSCKRTVKNITIDGVTDDLFIEIKYDKNFLDKANIIFNGVKYDIYTSDLEYLYFYKANDELITYVGGAMALYGIHLVKTADFGTVFCVEDFLFRVIGLNADAFYYLPEYADIPSLENIVIDDIYDVSNVGWLHNYVYTEWSSVDEMISAVQTKCYDRNSWNRENDTILLGEFIDFNESVILSESHPTGWDIIITPRDYESFFCGPFDVIEIDGEYYVTNGFPREVQYAYKVHDKYQFVFADRVK